MSKTAHTELTYPLGTTSRLTGLSPEVLRAWERRYEAVKPLRTAGGTRRYRASDLERLQLLKTAVDRGQRIGQVARLENQQLRDVASSEPSAPGNLLDPLFECLDQLDAPGLQRLLGLQLSTLGPRLFVDTIAAPFTIEIGERWSRGELGIAAEHLATGVLRSLLGASLQPSATTLSGPAILFATPSSENHELGIMMGALTALGAGANVTYLGPNLPTEELLRAVDVVDAEALALSFVTLSHEDANRTATAIRDGLPGEVHLWLGGSGASQVEPQPGIEVIPSFGALERRVLLLREERS